MAALETLERSWKVRLVYECLCAFDLTHENEAETQRWTTREHTIKHIIAPTQKFAEDAFRYNYGSSYELISCIPICSIDNEVIL